MMQVIHIPKYHPPTVNELLENRWAASRLKKKCVKTVWDCILEQKITKASGRRLVEIIITTSIHKKGRRKDPDSVYKSVLDALVKCNMLVDDSARWCEHLATVLMDGEHDATTIKLTDIENLPPGNAWGSVHPQYVKPKGRK